MVSPAKLCLICKGGRNLCGWRVCPLLSRINIAPKIKEKVGLEFFGPSTSIFIGHNFYPNVYMGPLTALENENLESIDSPKNWFGKPYSDIIELRSLLLRSKYRENVHSRTKFVEKTQELAIASKPTDVELGFKKKPVYRFEFSDITQPMGPSASLKKFKITENPKIQNTVERVVTDELKAGEASFLLYRKGVDFYKIITILSSGILGKKEGKRLVPTRWSITATDDIVTNNLLKNVRNYRPVNEYMVFESEYLDNHFVILLMPGNWEFENFEAWSPGTTWSFSLKKTEILEEYEPHKGRTTYASLQGGGYYASRFSIVQHLEHIKRQARIVGFREISEGYVIPLGVWVIRETVKKAFEGEPKAFQTKQEALKYIDSRLRLPLKEYLKKSKILKQKRLGDF